MSGSVKSFRNVDVTHDAGKVAEQTASASTLPELISTIPRAYQSLLGHYLTQKFRVAHKHANVQSTITLYERHATDGSFPPVVRNSLKEPRLQFAKEFLATTTGSNSPEAFKAAVDQARKNVLNAALLEKKKELAHLATLVAVDEETWQERCRNVARTIAEGNGGRMEHSGGSYKFTGLPDPALKEYQLLVKACAVYTYRTVALARASIDRAELQKIQKLKIKETTDVEMTDVGKEQPVRDIIREELKALESRTMQKIGTSTPAKRRAECTLTNTSHAKREKVQRESAEEDYGQEKCETRWQKEALAEEEISVDAFMRQCSKDFRPWLPEEYPTVYCVLNDSSRMKIAFSFLKEWEADSIRTASPEIFKHPDVVIPEDIEYMLAVNHKYVLHPKPQDHDVLEAKDKLIRAIRVKWFFRRGDRQNQEYIPKFHVPNPFWEPPPASTAIELGIESAMKEIDHQVGQALSCMAGLAPSHRNMNWTRVQDFLLTNGLVTKLTDKNLGLAVFPKEWYVHNCMKMLGDLQTYRMVAPVDTEKLLGRLIRQLSKWHLPRNMRRFIEEKTTAQIPVFHAIPKVHKEPWALRPIVPSHSWVTSRLSEVIDHLCRPILQYLPWVVGSTKEVIQQLEEVRIESDDVWICTGDVVAFYTNIDGNECAQVVAGAWNTFMPDSKIHAKQIKHMIRFVMENNYFSFQNQQYQQMAGLAMGTASAPTLANIYAGYYERKTGTRKYPGVRKYMRYIDDILMVFQGTEKELTAFLAWYQLGPLEVNWAYSRVKKEFLDIEIMRIRDQTGVRLDTRLFKKPMNKHLYIPWSSAHPSHVKKAFVKAELIRFAIVSSQVEYFADARAQFYGNLRRRGYPTGVLDQWFRQVSYEQRPLFLSRKKDKEEAAPLMLSGTYNPVWEYINVDEILRSARRCWSQEIELPDSLQQPLIRSLRRYTNLSDLLSVWNKTVLHPPMLGTESDTLLQVRSLASRARVGELSRGERSNL